MQILKTFNEENVSPEEMSKFRIRTSVRAIILDDDNRVAMLYSRGLNYYTLPGGGVDEGESISEAIIRECKEETGYAVEIIREIGTTVEIRQKDQLINNATCFLVKVLGEKSEPEFMEDEIAEDFVIEWMTGDEAKKYITEEIPLKKKLYHRYISERALAFLNQTFK